MQATLEKVEGLPTPRVRLTLNNDGATHVHLAKDRLCLLGKFDGDYFTIQGGGHYKGERRNPAPYSGDELVKLAAGEDLIIEINLADWYNLKAGAILRYKTCHSSIYRRVEIESNWVEL